jgi:hypothetical protein
MRRTAEVARIEAALKRAAQRAVHGTQEERSGRYLPTEEKKNSRPARRVSKQVRANHREA